MSPAPSAWASMVGLPRAVWWLSGAVLVNRMGAMVFPFLVLYFHRSLKLDLETATGIAACYGIGSGFAAPLGGWLADRYDAIRVLTFSMAAAGIVLLGFPWLRSPYALMPATFAIALLADLSRPSSLTALARLGGEEKSRDAFALNYLAINLGMSVGPLVGGYLAGIDYKWLFWVDGVSSLLACALLTLSGTRSPAPGRDGPRPDWNIGRTGFRAIGWFILALCVFLSFLIATPIYVVEELHHPESMVGWVWLLNTGLIVLTTMQINHWTRNQPLTRQLTLAGLLFAVGYALVLLIPGMPGLLACILLLTVGEMMLFTNVNSYLQKVVAPHKMGRAMAMNSVAFSIALSSSTPMVGYFFSRGMADYLWLALAVGGLLSAWGFHRLPETAERTEAAERSEP